MCVLVVTTIVSDYILVRNHDTVSCVYSVKCNGVYVVLQRLFKYSYDIQTLTIIDCGTSQPLQKQQHSAK